MLRIPPFVAAALFGILLATPASAVPNAVALPVDIDGDLSTVGEKINDVRSMLDLPLPCIFLGGGGGNGMGMACYVCVRTGGYGEVPFGFFEAQKGTTGGYVAAGYSPSQGWGPYVGGGAAAGDAQC